MGLHIREGVRKHLKKKRRVYAGFIDQEKLSNRNGRKRIVGIEGKGQKAVRERQREQFS